MYSCSQLSSTLAFRPCSARSILPFAHTTSPCTLAVHLAVKILPIEYSKPNHWKILIATGYWHAWFFGLILLTGHACAATQSNAYMHKVTNVTAVYQLSLMGPVPDPALHDKEGLGMNAPGTQLSWLDELLILQSQAVLHSCIIAV